jgi:hypothetical protein
LEAHKLTVVYGPCLEPARSLFTQWLKDQQIQPLDSWLFLGDFNFYRSLEDRNKHGENLNDTFLFNDIIGQLGLVELPIKGQFGRAPRADSLLNPARALPNSFSERSDSLLILWSDSLK